MPSAESGALRELFLDLAKAFEAAGGKPELDRAIYDGVHKAASEATDVSYEDTIVNGVPCKWVRPAAASQNHVMLFFHGGGYTFGSPNGHRKMTAHLAKASDCLALSVDYRLAPENPYPAGLDDCMTVYRWLLSNGFPAANIVTAGDSCGGGLATIVSLAALKQGLPVPGAAVAISPNYDHTGTGETMTTNEQYDVLNTKPFCAELTKRYLQGKHDIKDPLISPLFADNLGDLPPHWISCAGYDLLCDQGERLAAEAKAAGAEVVVKVHPEMQHVFEFMAGKAAEADDSIADIGKWVQQQLKI